MGEDGVESRVELKGPANCQNKSHQALLFGVMEVRWYNTRHECAHMPPRSPQLETIVACPPLLRTRNCPRPNP